MVRECERISANEGWKHKKPLIARISTDCADISFNHPRPICVICGEPRMEPQGTADCADISFHYLRHLR
jgi:hypothetical protein